MNLSWTLYPCRAYPYLIRLRTIAEVEQAEQLCELRSETLKKDRLNDWKWDELLKTTMQLHQCVYPFCSLLILVDCECILALTGTEREFCPFGAPCTVCMGSRNWSPTLGLRYLESSHCCASPLPSSCRGLLLPQLGVLSRYAGYHDAAKVALRRAQDLGNKEATLHLARLARDSGNVSSTLCQLFAALAFACLSLTCTAT